MAETIDEITINWEDDEGRQVVKELQKEVLSKGSWTTIMFLYQELDKRTDEYRAPKIRIGRYQKRGGAYIPQSKFNISSPKQARKIVDILSNWLEDLEAQD